MQGHDNFASPSQIGFWIKEVYEQESGCEAPWIDPNRVAKSLREMFSDGIVECRAGKGTFGNQWRLKR